MAAELHACSFKQFIYPSIYCCIWTSVFCVDCFITNKTKPSGAGQGEAKSEKNLERHHKQLGISPLPRKDEP